MKWSTHEILPISLKTVKEILHSINLQNLRPSSFTNSVGCNVIRDCKWLKSIFKALRIRQYVKNNFTVLFYLR